MAGHICDHDISEQCYNEKLVPPPRLYNGWLWVGSESSIPPANLENLGNWTYNPWGNTGVYSKVGNIFSF